MRALFLAALLSTGTLTAQTPSSTPAANASSAQAALTQALQGHWTGVLEYRDYSEPATSTKRVQLPTWLSVSAEGSHLVLLYTYDDGPSKVLSERETLTVDLAGGSYTMDSSAGTDFQRHTYAISNRDSLKDGRGTLTLTGPGTDNNKPAEIRTTWTIRRNLLSWLEEVRPAGSTEAFTFRHRYTFTRAEAPAPTNAPPK